MEEYLELSDIPNDKYKKLFDKFNEIETLDVNDWKVNHILGFFVKKYYETYGTKYKFKFNSPAPSKCFEIFQIKKLVSILTSNPSILKEYIEWVFLTKVIKAKRRLTSISFLTIEDTVNEYKMKILLGSDNRNIDRTTTLPEKYKEIFKELNIDLFTYGDLAFLAQSELTNELDMAFSRAVLAGLDLNMLKKVV